MQLTLIKKTDLTPTVKSYTFKPELPFIFEPGQFVMLKQVGAEQKCARAFSIVSEKDSDDIVFIMKHNPVGHVSGFLATAELGAVIETGAPVGRFVLNPADTDRVFVATGTGLAPIVSFFNSKNIATAPHTTIFGVRHEEDIFWADRLPKNSLITLSQPSESWEGLKGRVTAHTETLISEHPNAAWYMCGNPEMVSEVRAQLIAAGVEKTAIHFEIY
jgi:ferredoxin-NADP reductase